MIEQLVCGVRTERGSAMVALSENTDTVPETAIRGTMRRRGVIAAAAAVIAALAAKSVADANPVSANAGTWSLPYDTLSVTYTVASTDGVIAVHNNGTDTGMYGRSYGHGVFGRTYATTGGFAGVYGDNGNGSSGLYGVYGNGGSGTGVAGVAGGGYGVSGATSTGIGVYGSTGASGFGVYGSSGSGSGIGVYGSSSGNHSVFGNLFGGVANTAAVYGSGDGGSTYGVYGSNFGTATGVYGHSNSGVGVFGVSGGGTGQPFGVVGSVAAAPGFALYGVANVSGTVGFAAGAGVTGAIAGQFSGPVNIYNNGAIAPGNLYVQGNQTIVGTKSAAVPHPDGSHRLLYCMESPEAWFEDFGTGTITAGKAEVKFDTDFAAVVDTNTLHVFTEAHDETHHLAVKATSGKGFSVAADVAGLAARGVKAADVNGTFSYRVVAKRKDVKAERLARFELPKAITAPALVIPPSSKDEKKPAAISPLPLPQPPVGEQGKQGKS